MARYDFTCTKCTHAVEVNVSINDIEKHEQKCEKCGADMQRLFNMPFVKYVGPGFYKTEYATQHLGGGMELRHK